MMQAIVVEQTGGPEVLVAQAAPAPVPGPGELLVETAAVGVNFIEIYQRGGVYAMELPYIPGAEAAGTVLAVGDGVTDFAPGDRIATAAARGTYAEQFVVAGAQAVIVPAGVELDVAGALPLQGCTAHYLAFSVATPQPGEWVLLHAGAGGVGQLLTQLLVAHGVRVIATASTDEKRALCREAGAEHALPYEGFAERVREITNGAGVAVAYDGVGRDTFDGSLASLRVRGDLVLFGGASGQVPPFDLQRLNAGGSLRVSRPTLGHFMLTPEERAWRYRELFDAVSAGTLRVRIGERFALADAAEAHRALAGRGTTGKVILVP
ncbi:quinone oxidoreductase [Leucobacter sp. cx-328]|uniref:quinone oxidoreductase family protein n=1 Tax=unclassified Leucobacter TaxID=2621730 RepID=UPI00165DC26B|nr:MULTISPECIES: quinone oxidoreductase [unclassified Leucobacter]MBC9944785.1 quinone oxidoreductase [Leucobacter sp. cx-328]